MAILCHEYPEGEHADNNCSDCEGKGRIYNNNDPSCGQWVACECVSKKAMINVDDLVRRLIGYMKNNPEKMSAQILPYIEVYKIINGAEKFYQSSAISPCPLCLSLVRKEDEWFPYCCESCHKTGEDISKSECNEDTIREQMDRGVDDGV